MAPRMNLAYAFSRHAPRVDLYLYGTSRHAANELYDRLYQQKEQIEQRFGGPLGWHRLDGKNDSRINVELPPASVREQENWEGLQDKMIDLMIRFEKALRPAVQAIPQ
jgi:hypothetical protein